MLELRYPEEEIAEALERPPAAVYVYRRKKGYEV
jgi:hypothetical protein